MNDTSFAGEIVVASRIVEDLSNGLYETPAACLKELINNAYDADATEVNVFIKPDADRIIIEDNGHGMSKPEFVKHFSRVSESYKRDESDETESGRSKIGKIGIGFIAANELCDIMEIHSTKEGSSELLRVEINFHVMRQERQERERDLDEVSKGDYEGEILEADQESHFTHIFLKKVRDNTREIFAGASELSVHVSGDKSLYGLSAESIKRELTDPKLKSWTEFDAYSRNLLNVGLNVPVEYYQDWIPDPANAELTDFREFTRQLQFSLHFDGSLVLKPVIFSADPEAMFIKRFEFQGHYVSASGYFYAQHTAIKPQELQGLLIRIRNAAIGDYDQSFLGFSPSTGPILQSWISAEIWASDELEQAMNIDRQTLRVDHPAYRELQTAIHEELSSVIQKARSDLYGKKSTKRKEKQAREIVQAISGIGDRLNYVTPETAAELRNTWATVEREEKGVKRILRKYTVAELYETTLEVAEEVMTPEQLQEFTKLLTARLSK